MQNFKIYKFLSAGKLSSETIRNYLIKLMYKIVLLFNIMHHIHAFTIHVTVLILLKGVLFARSSRLIPDKSNLGFRFPCDGPGRGGTCQVSAWDHIFLGLFWMVSPLKFSFYR